MFICALLFVSEDMDTEIEESLDDECLDDPITLIDFEQARVNAIWQGAGKFQI
jgi:hypothetical protein